jgi:hypothetical protein
MTSAEWREVLGLSLDGIALDRVESTEELELWSVQRSLRYVAWVLNDRRLSLSAVRNTLVFILKCVACIAQVCH